jgi:hypothetical protein
MWWGASCVKSTLIFEQGIGGLRQPERSTTLFEKWSHMHEQRCRRDRTTERGWCRSDGASYRSVSVFKCFETLSGFS